MEVVLFQVESMRLSKKRVVSPKEVIESWVVVETFNPSTWEVEPS